MHAFRVEMAAVCLDMCALYALCLVLLLGKRAWLAGPSIYLYWNDTFDWQQSDGNASIVRITSTGVADDEGNVYVAGSITSINPEDGSEGDDNVFVGCINEDDEIFWTQEVGRRSIHEQCLLIGINDDVVVSLVE